MGKKNNLENWKRNAINELKIPNVDQKILNVDQKSPNFDQSARFVVFPLCVV